MPLGSAGSPFLTGNAMVETTFPTPVPFCQSFFLSFCLLSQSVFCFWVRLPGRRPTGWVRGPFLPKAPNLAMPAHCRRNTKLKCHIVGMACHSLCVGLAALHKAATRGAESELQSQSESEQPHHDSTPLAVGPVSATIAFPNSSNAVVALPHYIITTD